jgi:DNA-binding response OmpR family regulator
MADSKKKLLIVEDDGILRQLLVEIFSKDYVVVAAEDGEQAVQLSIAEKPDLILLDLLLPKKDGFEVLDEVRKNSDKKIAQTPVVVLSNLYTNEDILRAENLIISAYFVKAHSSIPEVKQKIKEVLAEIIV